MHYKYMLYSLCKKCKFNQFHQLMKRTLLILGAGVSTDIHRGFPTGNELIQLIDVHLITTRYVYSESKMDWYISPLVNRIKEDFGMDFKQTTEFVHCFKRKLWAKIQDWYYENFHRPAEPISIDQLIAEEFKEEPLYVEIAKYCIAYFIKGAEHGIFRDKNGVYLKQNHWISEFSKVLETNTTTEFSVITFNYDRVLEYLLSSTVRLDIHHAYGSIGELKDFKFDENNNSVNLKVGAQKIKLIHEREPIPDRFSIEHFDSCMFAGFGYDEKNMRETLKMNHSQYPNCVGMAYQEITEHHQKVMGDFGFVIQPWNSISAFLFTNLYTNK